jgi:hypothetical protein
VDENDGGVGICYDGDPATDPTDADVGGDGYDGGDGGTGPEEPPPDMQTDPDQLSDPEN